MSGIIGQRGIGQRSGVIGPAASTQPAFLCSGDDGAAYDLTATYGPYTTDNDVTGFVEVFDQANNVTTSSRKSTFTAPVTGRYLFAFSAMASGYTSGDEIDVWLHTSNREYICRFDSADVKFTPQMAVIADMDASDTAYVRSINWNGARGTLHAGDYFLSFSGCLLA